jgi:hypothetical protein
MFLAGAAMVVAGGYLFLTHVTVTSGGGWHWYGYNAFGLSLLPLLVGIGIIFYDGSSLLGWALTAAGALIIVVGILANLRVYFRPTSLFDTIMILGLNAGGIGLIVRSIRPLAAGSGRGVGEVSAGESDHTV